MAAAAEGLLYADEIMSVIENAVTRQNGGKALSTAARNSLSSYLRGSLGAGANPLSAATYALGAVFGHNIVNMNDREVHHLSSIQQEQVHNIAYNTGNVVPATNIPLTNEQKQIENIVHGIGAPQDTFIDIPLEETKETQPLLGLRNRAGRRPIVEQTVHDIANANPFQQNPLRPPVIRLGNQNLKKGIAATAAAAGVGAIAGSQAIGSQNPPAQTQPEAPQTGGGENTSGGSNTSSTIQQTPEQTQSGTPEVENGGLEHWFSPIHGSKQNSQNPQNTIQLADAEEPQDVPDSGIRGRFHYPKNSAFLPYKTIPYTQAMIHNMFV